MAQSQYVQEKVSRPHKEYVCDREWGIRTRIILFGSNLIHFVQFGMLRMPGNSLQLPGVRRVYVFCALYAKNMPLYDLIALASAFKCSY
jgi:hypothetical protein